MRIIQASVSAIAICIAVIPAMAQPEKPYNYMVFLKGRCTKLVVAGKNFTPICSSTLMNTSYRVGRVSFAVYLSDKKGAVSFSGTSDVQTSLTRYTLYLDKILLAGPAFGVETIYTNVAGICQVYGDPTKEVSTIRCRTEAQSQPVSELEFITDGTEPGIMR